MRALILGCATIAVICVYQAPATVLAQARAPIIDMHLQLHGDVSTISWVLPRAAFYDHLEALARARLGKRVMFGSDQMRWPQKIGEAIDAIERAPFLTEDQKRDILYHNAVRFLRLDEDASGTRPSKEE